MGEIVSLSKAKKARTRAERETQAAANRLKYGRPKAEIERKRREEARAERAHEAHKLEDDDRS